MSSKIWQKWESDVIKMRGQEKKTYAEIIEYLKPQFPNLTDRQLKDKIANLISKFNKIQKESAETKEKSTEIHTIKIEKPAEKTKISTKKLSEKENIAKKSTVQVTLEKEKIPEIKKEIDTVLAGGEVAQKKVSFNAKSGETIFEGIIALLQGEPITPEKVMKAHNLSPEEWQVMSFTSNSWQAQTKDSGKMSLWQSKITVKPAKEQAISLEHIEKHFANLSEKYKPKYLPPKIARESSKMLEINISDLHYAKLAWVGESGENYDYKIAKKRFDQIINAECKRLEEQDFEKILFVWTNDFFNSDTPDNNTTGGTPQSTDLRWQKMFNTGVETLVGAMDRLQQLAPIKTFYIASNHCRQTEYYATKYLSAWFRYNDRVDINTNGKARHYELYGTNLIGFSHSSFEKGKNIEHLMAVEAPDLWAKSKYREMHLAHIHCEKTEEKGGVIYRWLPSVTGTDQWHYDSGYVGAAKRSYSFTWDKVKGLEAINVVNIDTNDKKAKITNKEIICEK